VDRPVFAATRLSGRRRGALAALTRRCPSPVTTG
jgi:hypothetical protein